MRFLKALIALASLAAALPEPVVPVEGLAAPAAAVEEKRGKLDEMPVLDEVIARHEKEARTANLSPMNNPRDGMSQRNLTCPWPASSCRLY